MHLVKPIGEKLKKAIFVFLLVFVAVAFGQNGNTNTCISCHIELDEPLSTAAQQIESSVHKDAGLSCVGCHGGDPNQEDPELSMSKAKGFVGKPARKDIPQLCARCHSSIEFMRNYDPNFPVNQYERYKTSVHGQLLAKGDEKVAVCTDCHGIHDIKSAADPTSTIFPLNLADKCGQCHSDPEYMAAYGIESNQVELYKQSYHATMLYDKGDLSAPTCNDCHGNHGAVPPGIESIANVCGTCHYVQSQYFKQSPHKQAFDDMEISECEACHGNHAIHQATDEMLGVGEKGVCVQCHDEGDPGFKVAATFRTVIDSLHQSVTTAELELERARQAGVDVKDEKLSLPNSKDALTQIRALIHNFDLVEFEKIAAEGFENAQEARAISAMALKELGNRRRFLIIMVVFTLLVAAFLMLYIRNREAELK